MSKIIFGVLFNVATWIVACLALVRLAMSKRVLKWFTKMYLRAVKEVAEHADEWDD